MAIFPAFVARSQPTNSIPIPNIDDVHANASTANDDPFKFSHGLTGVDQPANYLFVNVLLSTALIPVFFAICFRIFTGIRNDRRRVSVITSWQGHNFWSRDRYIWWGWIKRYLLYSPIWSKRHNREIRLSSVVNMGTIPTRLQLIILVVYSFSNVAYCLAIPRQLEAQRIAEFRGRCGALAVFNMIFTILFALRNNPFIWLLHISYDTFNLFHRWTARIVFIEAIAHVFAFMYNTYRVEYDGESGWKSINWVLDHSLSYRWGLAAFVAFNFLMIHSIGPLRHAFYETFLSLHRLSIIVAICGVYYHMAKHALPQLPWGYLFITFLILEPCIRTGRILYYNSSLRRRTWTKVTAEALVGGATRVTFDLPRSWNANPGSYIHIYLPRLALWSSHPFSVAWSSSSGYAKLHHDLEKLPSSIEDLTIQEGPSTISCVIRARTGMTRTLYDKASKSKSNDLQLWGAVEGPYGGYHSLDSYGTVVLFAAGVGITHQMGFVRHLLAGHNSCTVAAQKILLIWCVPNTEVLAWIQPWLDEIMAMRNFREVVRIRLFVSKMPTLGPDGEALPMGLDIQQKRCDPQKIVDEEIISQIGAMVVTVCGPGAFSDSVRAAVRRRVGIRSVDFIEEAFSY